MQAKRDVNDSSYCTAFPLTPILKLPYRDIPINILRALQSIYKSDYVVRNNDCEDYVKCIKSLFNMRKIERQDYLYTLKMCLYVEQYEIDKKLIQQELKNHDIKRAKDLSECFIITMPSSNNENSIIVPDDRVTLQEVITKKTIPAIVVAVLRNEVTIRLIDNQYVEMMKKTDKKFNINFKSQHWPFRCCHYALSVMSYRKWTQIMYPEMKAGNMHLKYDIDEWINPNVLENKEQKEAVRNILNKTAYPAPYIIFGPPGTGKTATLVEAICQILKNRPTEYILVCTASNAAADEITKRLIQYVPTNIIYRMYAPSRPWSTVNEKIRPCANFVNDISIFLSKDILLLKKVVITTLVTSIRLIHKKLRDDHFSYIFIDEASQATEPEMLIPLAITREMDEIYPKFHAQIIIAGDPHQLGPVVHCRQIENLFGVSMLERLMNDCSPYEKQDGKYNPNYLTKLVKNYRSHNVLYHISNKEFYDGELESCGGSNTQLALNWSHLPNKNFPMIFQEVRGTEERCTNYSVFNKAEVLMVIEYVRKLIGTKFGKYKITQKDIGIITPFKQQQLEIIHRLALIKLENITVGTVETFQGQERTVIIMSTVRSQVFNHDGIEHIGFLSNRKRFNVAMTRAKALMIIIGNPEIICTNKYWRMLWTYCKEHESYISVEDFSSPSKVENICSDTSNAQKLSITVELGKNKKTDEMNTRTLDNVLVRRVKHLTLSKQ